MLFSARVGNAELAHLCRRLATSMEAGLDARKIWSRESDGRSSLALRERVAKISEAVARGDSVSDGLNETSDFFPPLFREMVVVGEQTGKLAEVFRQLAEHYDHQVTLRRMFMGAIAWPAIQLFAAIGIIGLLIFIMGFLPQMEESRDGLSNDILGFGWRGTSGLVKYSMCVTAVGVAVFLLVKAVQRGLVWTRPLQRFALMVPGVGGCLQTMALSRLAWSLHVTLETGMNLKHSLRLSLGSTHNARYTDHTDQVVNEIMRGREIHEALADTGAFPREFLDTLEVGERSGRLPESMAILARQYQDQARRALATLTVLAGFAVWAMVAMMIVAMIFRLAFFYINTINAAGRM